MYEESYKGYTLLSVCWISEVVLLILSAWILYRYFYTMFVLIVRMVNNMIQPIPNSFFAFYLFHWDKAWMCIFKCETHQIDSSAWDLCTLLVKHFMVFKSVKNGILRTVYLIAEQINTRKWQLDDRVVDTLPSFSPPPAARKYFLFLNLYRLLSQSSWRVQSYNSVIVLNYSIVYSIDSKLYAN